MVNGNLVDSVSGDREWFVSAWSTRSSWNWQQQSPVGWWEEERASKSLVRPRSSVLPFFQAFTLEIAQSQEAGFSHLTLDVFCEGVYVWSNCLDSFCTSWQEKSSQGSDLSHRCLIFQSMYKTGLMNEVPKVCVLLINTSFLPAVKFHKTYRIIVTLNHLYLCQMWFKLALGFDSYCRADGAKKGCEIA